MCNAGELSPFIARTTIRRSIPRQRETAAMLVFLLAPWSSVSRVAHSPLPAVHCEYYPQTDF